MLVQVLLKMTNNDESDPKNLTFSQAQGYGELPGPLALEEISDEARVRLWDLLDSSAWREVYIREEALFWEWQAQWGQVFMGLHRDFLVRPMDGFPGARDSAAQYRNLILHELPFNKLFDLLQMIMRHPSCPREFTVGVGAIFEQCRLAYLVDTKRPATILPAVTRQEGEAITDALHEFRGAGLGGAEAHLRKASELINGGDWPGAVRESINTVESVARQLDPEASKTLGPALTSLERRGRLHPALKEAFSKLYGYTSDEEGVRHPLLANTTSPAGRDEAVFMLGACASFASYLWRKHR